MGSFKGSYFLLFAHLFAFAHGRGHAGDATMFVQSRLADPNAEAVAIAPDVERFSYRLLITRTNGGDHVCLNELDFEDKFAKKLTPQFESMSSCYGCASGCKGCETEYGNAVALFDGEADGDTATWSCSEHGTFNTSFDKDNVDTGYGEEAIAFSLPGKLLKYGVTVKQVGSWSPKDWSVQQWLADLQKWSTIGKVSDVSAFMTHWATVSEGSLDIPTNYPDGWHFCQSANQATAALAADVEVPSLNITLRSEADRILKNSGHGAQVEGDFGFLTYSGTMHSIMQVNWRFPSEFRLPNGVAASGEMHIVCVSATGKLVVINLLLQLPAEHESLDTDTEHFFLNLGLAAIPEEGSPRDVGTFDISLFDTYLQGGFVEMPCDARPDVTWVVLTKPAMVSGAIVQAFQTRFPNPLAYMTDEVTKLPDASDPSSPLQFDGSAFQFTPEQQALAYASGEWAQGPQVTNVQNVSADGNNKTVDDVPAVMTNDVIASGAGV